MFSQEEVLHWFNLLDAGWIHNGDPKMPHAELTSGLCSNGFFDCLRVLRYVNLSRILAEMLVSRLQEAAREEARKTTAPFFDVQGRTKWVLGSPMAAITFAHDVAIALGAPINMFLEKDPELKGRLLWNRMQIPEGESVLQIEELITTAHTTNEVMRAVIVGNSHDVTWAPFVGALVHRPPKVMYYYGGRRVVSVIEKQVWAVKPDECPLCAKGSPRLRPKQNWAKLTGKY
jgi:orotate phosphoribosyltransferase